MKAIIENQIEKRQHIQSKSVRRSVKRSDDVTRRRRVESQHGRNDYS